MTDIWFRPTRSAASCYYRVADPAFAPAGVSWAIQTAHSACGVWKTRIDLKKPTEDGRATVEVRWEKPVDGGPPPKPLAPAFEVCAKCCAVLGITPRPQRVHTLTLSALSSEDRICIEEMPTPPPTPPDPPNELEGIDLSEL
jgi:hypothetical protein